MSVHIGAKNGDIAETVLLPGDPMRAKWLAETYFEDPVCHNSVRGMLGYTGRHNGQRISVQGSGMGIPSLSIYVNELIRDFNVKTVIRIGSCGGLREDTELGDLVIAMSAGSDSAINRLSFDQFDYAATADWSVTQALVAATSERGVPHHIGQIFSTDRFYPDRETYLDKVVAHGVLAVEMEANALFTLAAGLGARAGAICTVSDNLVTGAQMPSEERETGFAAMAEIALAAVEQID